MTEVCISKRLQNAQRRSVANRKLQLEVADWAEKKPEWWIPTRVETYLCLSHPKAEASSNPATSHNFLSLILTLTLLILLILTLHLRSGQSFRFLNNHHPPPTVKL